MMPDTLPIVPVEEPPKRFGRFMRHGYCNRCGACCKSGDPFTGESGKACPLYRETGKVGQCTDRQNPYYLAACADWPSKPEHVALYPDCSYRFEPVSG